MAALERGNRRRLLVTALAVSALLVCGALALVGLSGRGSTSGRAGASIQSGRPDAVIDLGDGRRGAFFAPGAVGLSVEATGFAWRRLDPGRGNLASMMRLLGPSVLRIGGNAGDVAFWTARGERPPRWAHSIVVPADLRRLAGFARATGSRVVLTVNLGHVDPKRAASEVAEAQRILGRSLFGIEIGNEPDLFPGHGLRSRRTYDYRAFAVVLARYLEAISAAAPGVPLVGPDLSHTDWSMRYARTVGRRNREITQHDYSLWECPGTARPSIRALLGTRVRSDEDSILARLKRAGAAAGKPVAVTETNSVGCSGATGVSRTFASSLWALDWALRATAAGVGHIQFHDLLERCTARTYSPLCATPAAGESNVAPQPELYGLLAAARLENGNFLDVRLRGPESLTAYATGDREGTIRLALDDMRRRGAPQRVVVTLHSGYRADIERLEGPGLTATRGVRLGGAEIAPNGRFEPHERPLDSGARSLDVRLRAGSAAILTLTPAR